QRPRGGNFRPWLEALEGRLAPGALPGTPGLPLLDDPWGLAAQKREAAEVAAASSAAAQQTTQPVLDFVHRDVVLGESTLTRTGHGVTMHLTIPNVQAGVYTAWWVIFNPGVPPPPVVGWAAGHVVGEGGSLTFATQLSEGELISGHPVFPSGTLQDAREATV